MFYFAFYYYKKNVEREIIKQMNKYAEKSGAPTWVRLGDCCRTFLDKERKLKSSFAF